MSPACLPDVTPVSCRVRHEAAEALGAIGLTSCVEPLTAHRDDSSLEVCQLLISLGSALLRWHRKSYTCAVLPLPRVFSWLAKRSEAASHSGTGLQVAETCQLALARIDAVCGGAAAPADNESPYLSVDPTPAAPASTPLPALRAALLDEAAPLPGRYAAMFALRNRGGADAVAALAQAFTCRSALLKHEVAYVLGQMQDAEAFHVLKCVRLPALDAVLLHSDYCSALAIGETATYSCITPAGFSCMHSDSCWHAVLELRERHCSGAGGCWRTRGRTRWCGMRRRRHWAASLTTVVCSF